MNRYDILKFVINRLLSLSCWKENRTLIFSAKPYGDCRIDLSEKSDMHYISVNVDLRCLNKSSIDRFISSLEKITWKGEKKLKNYAPPLKYQRLCHLWVEDQRTKEYSANHVIPSHQLCNVKIIIDYEIPSQEFKKIEKHFGDFLSVDLTIKDSSAIISRARSQLRIHKNLHHEP